jgi:hypothetical protein
MNVAAPIANNRHETLRRRAINQPKNKGMEIIRKKFRNKGARGIDGA